MDAALEALVVKSGAWTVEEMSNELMYLNKLAYPFRLQYDRTRLMQVRWIASSPIAVLLMVCLGYSNSVAVLAAARGGAHRVVKVSEGRVFVHGYAISRRKPESAGYEIENPFTHERGKQSVTLCHEHKARRRLFICCRVSA